MNEKLKFYLSATGLAQIAEYAMFGMSVGQIARAISVTEKTLSDWRDKYKPISDALSGSEEFRSRLVEAALLKRALGYSYREITRQLNKDGEMTVAKTVDKDITPNTTAQMFWLKNRCGYIWDGSTEEESEDEGGLVIIPQAEQAGEEAGYE